MERNNSAVGAGRQNRDNNILSNGFSIRRGPAKTRASKFLYEFTIDWFKRIKRLNEVRKFSLDGMYHGFRPLENTFEPFLFKGKTYQIPVHIREKDQENFRFTETRDIAHYDRVRGEYIIFETDVARLKWFIPSYGSLNNPYGNGIYQKAFLIHFAKDKFFEMFAQGMQRSMGLLKATQKGFGGMVAPAASRAIDEANDAREVMSAAVNDIKQILDVFNSHNILVEKAGWAIEFLSNINFADGWIKALDYVDKQITLIVASEILSFQEGKFGSRAQSVIHAESGNKTAKVDGAWFDDTWNDLLIFPVLEYNHGEIDPDDMPKQISHCRIPLSLNDIKVAHDLGLDLDADEIARRFNLPLASDETKNVLKGASIKQPGPNKEDSRNNPKKQVQKKDEETRQEKDEGDKDAVN